MRQRYWLCLPCLLATTLPALGQEAEALSLEAINSASLDVLVEQAAADAASEVDGSVPARPDAPQPNPVIARLQILLDRAGASPAVIDGYDGENVSKGVWTFETLNGFPANGIIDPDVVSALETSEDVVASYTISEEDVSDIVDTIPEDYAELAELEYLGYTSVAEKLAEKFHMDIDFLKALNPDAQFTEGEEIVVAQPGDQVEGDVARIEADKARGQVRAYDAEDNLIVAYPATVGSESNPSPTGTHEVRAIAPEPNYTYNPDENFQQGDNDETLIIAPGPNNPVGSVWIDLSEPTYGIHGTPEPAEIDKTASHGCVRLTNWDAEELAGMVEQGVTVTFVQ
ncbi:MAG TPA: L,D-transpeptidase [Devosia sp.]|jgi:lipoprotein-anchoring transpeptidase ErfK/SrfK|nr:L,D-transpeptidase [Devosia sp.]